MCKTSEVDRGIGESIAVYVERILLRGWNILSVNFDVGNPPGDYLDPNRSRVLSFRCQDASSRIQVSLALDQRRSSQIRANPDILENAA